MSFFLAGTIKIDIPDLRQHFERITLIGLLAGRRVCAVQAFSPQVKTLAEGRLCRPEHFNPGGWRPPSAAGTQKERHDSRRVFLFGATDVTRTHDLLITKHGQTVQTPQNSRFPPFPLPRRILSSTLVSIISINSFCRVGHGVGQRPWSSSRNSGDISKVAV